MNLLLGRRDIVSGSDAKIFTFIASTNASLRVLHILLRRGTVSRYSSNLALLDESCFTLFTRQKRTKILQISVMISALLEFAVSDTFGRTNIRCQMATHAICLHYSDVSRIIAVVCARNNKMHFFTYHPQTHSLHWVYYSMLSLRKWKNI